jgi:hypothetical protein
MVQRSGLSEYDEPPVLVMPPGSNGMAVAALALGIVGVVSGLVPFFFLVSLPCGVLAFVFGCVSWRRANVRGVPGRGMARTGVVLGVVAVALGVIGVVITIGVWVNLPNALEEIRRM